MGESGSGIPLFVLLAGEDHPKACTGRKLLRQGLVRRWTAPRSRSEAPLLLDPRATVPLSREDERFARRNGLLVVDCSWNLFDGRGGFAPRFDWVTQLARRRLPLLLAGNPQHYGRLAELSTAEALAAALAVLVGEEHARTLLSTFRGAAGFFALNGALLQSYRDAPGPAEIIDAERDYF